MSTLFCTEIEPKNTADASVIWLHGLGATCHDFEPIIPELNLPADHSIRFVFPQAPEIPVTINNGIVMPAWYDIVEMSIDRKVDEKQLKESAVAVQALIERELERGISSDRIILAGFSQGGAVVYEAGLSYSKPLAGVLALSTYFATADSVEPNAANSKLPIQIFHGEMDGVVPVTLGQKAYQQLTEMGHPTAYQSYRMEHQVCMEEIKAISEWLQEILIETSIADIESN